MTTNYEELEKLAKLKEQGIISDEEFEIEKKKILSGDNGKVSDNKKVNNDFYHDNSKDTFFQKIFSSKGRINRREYFTYSVLLMVFSFLIMFIFAIFFEYVLKEEINDGLLNVISLPGYLISIIITVKRLHDINFSAWWFFFAPIYLILPFAPGIKGDNRFGNESKVNDSILNPLFFISIFLFIIGIVGTIFVTILILEEKDNTNTQVETNTCGKNSAKNEGGSCSCLAGYEWEDYNNDNNLNCIKK